MKKNIAGILPMAIMNLVQRRRSVKNLLKDERDPSNRLQLDIRQKALKLVANSMYGCLGFSYSRFFCKSLASLITSLGRSTLSRTVDATQELGFDVIYGDTDSIMIHTRSTDIGEVKGIAEHIKKEINKRYSRLEIDLDGIFKCLLLLKKKKYVALTIVEKNGALMTKKEMKGIDLVRRDWCALSKEAGLFVIDQILSCKDREEIADAINERLSIVNKTARAMQFPLEKFIITKSLTKLPNQYSDAKSHPHVTVALKMLEEGRTVGVGDIIPYIICEGSGSLAERAYHPYALKTNEQDKVVDVEWYLENQVLAPVARLVEPIEDIPISRLASSLGLDPNRYTQVTTSSSSYKEDNFSVDVYHFDDFEAFRDIEAVRVPCLYCNQVVEFRGLLDVSDKSTTFRFAKCPTARCPGLIRDRSELHHVLNAFTVHYRQIAKQHFRRVYRCDEESCPFYSGTRHFPRDGHLCPMPGCDGKLSPNVILSLLSRLTLPVFCSKTLQTSSVLFSHV